MPEIEWNKLSEIKHALSQERTIVHKIRLHLMHFDIEGTLRYLEMCDRRLSELEEQFTKTIDETGDTI